MPYVPKLNDYFVGREVFIEFAPGDFDDEAAAEASFLELGATRGVSDSGSAETVDMTNRSSPGSFRQRLITYTEMTGSIDGVITKGADSNVRAVRDHFYTDEKKQGWLRLTSPDSDGGTEVMAVPVVLSQFDRDFNYEGEPTFTMNWEAQEQPTFDQAPAPAPAP